MILDDLLARLEMSAKDYADAVGLRRHGLSAKRCDERRRGVAHGEVGALRGALARLAEADRAAVVDAIEAQKDPAQPGKE